MKLLELAKCHKRYIFFPKIDFESKLCTESNTASDICYGDSGGPLVCTGNSTEGGVKEVLAGIVAVSLGCNPVLGSAYTAVSNFHSFILYGEPSVIVYGSKTTPEIGNKGTNTPYDLGLQIEIAREFLL